MSECACARVLMSMRAVYVCVRVCVTLSVSDHARGHECATLSLSLSLSLCVCVCVSTSHEGFLLGTEGDSGVCVCAPASVESTESLVPRTGREGGGRVGENDVGDVVRCVCVCVGGCVCVCT